MGEFYYELSVKVAEVCFATRTQNGGIMPVSQALDILNRSSSSSTRGGDSRAKKYNEGDIKIAVKKLGQLGGGFRIVQVGGGGTSDGGRNINRKRGGPASSSDMIISVPTELDEDHTSILTLASGQGGCVTVDDVQKHMPSNWTKERIDRAITLLLQEGMAWKDEFHGIDFYWIPSVWKEQQQQQH